MNAVPAFTDDLNDFTQAVFSGIIRLQSAACPIARSHHCVDNRIKKGFEFGVKRTVYKYVESGICSLSQCGPGWFHHVSRHVPFLAPGFLRTRFAIGALPGSSSLARAIASVWVSLTSLTRLPPGLFTSKRPSSRCCTRSASLSRSGGFAWEAEAETSSNAFPMARRTSAAVKVFDLVLGASTFTPSKVLPTVL